MKKNVLYWVCQICGWGLHAFFNIFMLLALFDWKNLSIRTFLVPFLLSAISIFLTHLYRLYIKKNQWVSLSYLNLIPKVLVASVFLSIVNFLFQYTVTYLMNFSDIRFRFQVDDFLRTGIVSIGGFIIVHFGWSLIYFMYHYIEQHNQNLKDQAALKDFELNKLKSQLNPHFIFNALNSIRALVDEDPGKCKNAINQLSNILRNSLIMDKQKLIPFAEELKAVTDYLALETIRFEERLNSEIKIHPETYSYKVPPLMIQTLVENGIKHGISKLKEGGLIKLETSIDVNSNLIIRIRNSGIYKAKEKTSTGHGLMNTKRRLKLLYGENAAFHIQNGSDNMVLTEVVIPGDKFNFG
jgi:two-component system, LytTR family, sensor kinase